MNTPDIPQPEPTRTCGGCGRVLYPTKSMWADSTGYTYCTLIGSSHQPVGAPVKDSAR